MFGVVYMDFNISFDMAKYPTQLKPVVSMESGKLDPKLAQCQEA